MKYLIIGAGGTGGCIGAYLAKSGKDVTFIARGSHLKAMKENGLRVNSVRVDDFVISDVKACNMNEYKDEPDVIFVCVKYYSIDETIQFINRIAKRDTVVIPILNVFTTGEVIQKSCRQCTVLDGCVYIVSMIEDYGVINQPAPIFKIHFGFRENQERKMQPLVEEVCKDLNDSNIDAYFTDNIKKEALKKFSYVSPIGAAGVYYDAVGGDFMVEGKAQDTFKELIREVEKLGNAMGIEFEEDLVEVNMKILSGVNKDSTTSMQRDIANGGPSEFDGLVHSIVRLAEKYNVEVPAYKMISEWGKSRGII